MECVFHGRTGAYSLAHDVKFRGGAGGEQDFGVLLDGEAEYASHIEPFGARRGDPADQFRGYRTATPLCPAIEDLLHLGGIPRGEK
jgi:hypothetical protein